MNHIKRISALIALALTLVLPTTSVFAADTADTTESLTVASVVSMTAQATATYATGDEDGGNGPDYSARIILTVLSSNNPSGVTVKAKVDPFVTAGAISVPTTARDTYLTEIDCRTGDGLSAPHQDSTPPGTGGPDSNGFVCPNTPAPVTRSGSPLVKTASVLSGAFTNSSTSVALAASTGPLANADLGTIFVLDADAFPVGGLFTSAVHWQTVTNS